jgi:hypothetical protein
MVMEYTISFIVPIFVGPISEGWASRITRCWMYSKVDDGIGRGSSGIRLLLVGGT